MSNNTDSEKDFPLRVREYETDEAGRVEIIEPTSVLARRVRRESENEIEPLIIEPIWERQPNEANHQWAAFQVWLNALPRVRTYSKVAEATGYNAGTLRLWGHKWSWDERAREYNAFLFTEEQEERLRQIRERERIRMSRQAQLEEKLWANQQLLIEKAEAMLDLPLTEQVLVSEEKDDAGNVVKQVYHVKPVRANPGMAAEMLQIGARLGQASLGMPTHRVEVSGKGEPRTNLDNLGEEELATRIQELKRKLLEGQ